MTMNSKSFPFASIIKDETFENVNNCMTCFESGCFKSVFETYHHNEVVEIYANMLSYCFSLIVDNSEEQFKNNYFICDCCILILRSATAFRKQIDKAQRNFLKRFNKYPLSFIPSEIKIDFELAPLGEYQKFEEMHIKSEHRDQTQNDQSDDSNDILIECVNESKQNSPPHDDLLSFENIILPPDGCTIQTIIIDNKSVDEPKIDVDVREDKQNRFSDDSDFAWEENTIPDPPVFFRLSKYALCKGFYFCSKCPYNSEKYHDVNHHYKQIHMPKRQLMCDECGHLSNTSYALFRHKMIHTGLRPYACGLCKFKSSTRSELKCHMRIHTNNKAHCCEQCGAKFHRMTQLRAHQNVHSTAKLSCPRCSFTTNCKANLKVHTKKHDRIYQCEYCEEFFDNPTSFNFHNKLKHKIFKPRLATNENTGDYIHLCNICGKTFKILASLKLHLVVHSDEKPFRCSQCSYSSKRIGDLKIHKRIHVAMKTFACKLCPRRFKSQSKLHEHQDGHSKKKLLSCIICDYKCVAVMDLKKHVLIHTGKQHFCADCEYKSYSKQNLRKHVLQHMQHRPNQLVDQVKVVKGQANDNSKPTHQN